MNLVQSVLTAGMLTSAANSAVTEAKYITIVKGVSKNLLPHTDFEINGTLLVSIPMEQFKREYGTYKLSDIEDLTKFDVKFMWSEREILATDENSPFMPNLVVRVVNYDSVEDTAQIVALRNKYGSSLVTLDLT